MLPFFGVVVARVTLNQSKVLLFSIKGSVKRILLNLCLEAYSSKVLLTILFADRVLIVGDRQSLEVMRVGIVSVGGAALETLVLSHEGHSECLHDLGFFPFEVKFTHGLLHCYAQIAPLNYVLHLKYEWNIHTCTVNTHSNTQVANRCAHFYINRHLLRKP